MDIAVNTNLFKYATRMLDRNNKMTAMTDHVPHKPLCPINTKISQEFPRALPEKMGISSKTIAAFLNECINIKKLNLHGIMIIKDGYVICESDIGPYSSGLWHVCHSLSKTVTATAIGMLIDEGKLSLDDRVAKLLEKRVRPIHTLGYRNLTVRHLLTMTSGASFAETGTVVEKNWLRAYFESGVTFKAGTKYHYNSLNSYVLSALVKEITGQGLCEYLKGRLFEPLGIETYHWELSPEGIENGGWGLYLMREDIAKLAQLYLNNGIWNNKRIISEKWVKSATFTHVKTPEYTGDFDYGYHIWVNSEKEAFLFNGMFCQDALVLKKQRMIIVTNGGLEQLFQQSEYYKLIFKYFYYGEGPEAAPKSLKSMLKRLNVNTVEKTPLFSRVPKGLSDIVGITYNAEDVGNMLFKGAQRATATASCGILPLAEQGLRNSYAEGIKSITVSKEGKKYFLSVQEGSVVNKIPFIIGKTVKTVLRLSQTDYHVAVSSRCGKNEDGVMTVILRLDFLEVASTRYIKLYIYGSALSVKMSEEPGLGLVRRFADEIENMLMTNKFVSDVVSLIDADAIFCKLEKRFEPTFVLFKP